MFFDKFFGNKNKSVKPFTAFTQPVTRNYFHQKLQKLLISCCDKWFHLVLLREIFSYSFISFVIAPPDKTHNNIS